MNFEGIRVKKTWNSVVVKISKNWNSKMRENRKKFMLKKESINLTKHFLRTSQFSILCLWTLNIHSSFPFWTFNAYFNFFFTLVLVLFWFCVIFVFSSPNFLEFLNIFLNYVFSLFFFQFTILINLKLGRHIQKMYIYNFGF